MSCSTSDIEVLTHGFRTNLDIVDRLEESSWEDVTQLLHTAAEQLETGSMYQCPGFSLFDSMSALELMDPKMDSGMICDRQDGPIVPIQHRLAHNLIPFSFTNAKDVLATLDYLFQCEAAFYSGQSLAQTFYSCLYMHPCVFQVLLDTSESEAADTSVLHDVLTSYCAALALTLYSLRKDVLRADVFEDEDFSIATSNIDLSLDGKLTLERVLALLEKTIKRLEATTELDADSDVNSKLCTALSLRLKHRQQWLLGISELSRQCAEGIDRAQKHVNRALSTLRSTSDDRIDLGDSFFNGDQLGVDQWIPRLLSATTPPRDVSLPTYDESLKLQLSITEELAYVCDPEPFESLEELRRVLRYFAAKNPNIIARSYMMLCIYTNETIYGRHNFTTWLSNSMVSYGAPSILLTSQDGMGFVVRCLKPIYETLRVYLHHPSRQRQRIGFMLEDWAYLQQQASILDRNFETEMQIKLVEYPRYSSAWTMEQALDLMIHYTTLGLELELYDPVEYPYVYWYLDCLMTSRLQNLNIIAAFMQQMRQHTEAGKVAESTGKKGKKKKKGKAVAQNSSHEKLTLQIGVLEMYCTTVRGLSQFVNAMKLDGILPCKDHPYGSLSIRYNYRFAAFAKLIFPKLLPYDIFVENSDYSRYQSKQVYSSAAECFKLSRKLMEKLSRNSQFSSKLLQEEMQHLVKLSVANGVSLARWTPNKQSIAFDCSIHRAFPWIHLTK